VAVFPALASCAFVTERLNLINGGGMVAAPARYLQIEVDNPNEALPCRVVDRPDAETREVIWRARYEVGFCREKAEETRIILESQGWACRPLSAQEQRGDERLQNDVLSNDRSIVAAWRCLGGLEPVKLTTASEPSIPVVKPADLTRSTDPAAPASSTPTTSTKAALTEDILTDEALRATVEQDLKAIGQNVIDETTDVETALGDLNADEIDDAIVLLTRRDHPGRPHRLLMAYLDNEDGYRLVDVLVLDAEDDGPEDELALAIEDGSIRIQTCCDPQQPPSILALTDRKLSYVDPFSE